MEARDLENELRLARQASDTKRILEIKTLMGIQARVMQTTTVHGKNGSVLSVTQRVIDIVPCAKHVKTQEIDVYLR